MTSVCDRLTSFLTASPTAYHAVDTVKRALVGAGFVELSETAPFALAEGGKYFVTRNGSALIAFVYRKAAHGFMIGAAHTDSPAFRLKGDGEKCGTYLTLDVERYGGMILYSWFDRPLSVAGRVFVREADGIRAKLVNLDRDLVTIPSVAIHLNRGVNDGFKPNPAVDLLPLFGPSESRGSFLPLVAEAAGCAPEDILSHDLFLYTRQAPTLLGAKNEYYQAPRLDDLACAFTLLDGFLSASPSEMMPVLALFDNEEVGSETKQGAASTFLADTLARIGGDRLRELVAGSFMVSADNGHAKHPNHPELSDAKSAPVLGGGIVVKYNASQRYATDGLSDAVFREILSRADVPAQSYANRADLPGGSTLGSISDTKVSVPTVDIGLAQLAMHSAVELCSSSDIDTFARGMRAFFSATLTVEGSSIKIR